MNYRRQASRIAGNLHQRGAIGGIGTGEPSRAYHRALAMLRRMHSIHRVQVNRSNNWNEWTDIGGEA